MKKLLFTFAALTLFAVSCEKSPMPDLQPMASSATNSTEKLGVTLTDPQCTNPYVGTMSIFYKGELYTMQFTELLGDAADKAIAKTECLQTMYVAPSIAVPKAPYRWFYPVLDGIQWGKTNSIYIEKTIIYDTQIAPPFQFTSSEGILRAVAQHNMGITTEPNGKVVLVTVLLKEPDPSFID